MNSPEVVAEWVKSLRSQIERFLSFEGENAARMVNNLDWSGQMSALQLLRDVGKHFRVGAMVKKEIVAKRLFRTLSSRTRFCRVWTSWS